MRKMIITYDESIQEKDALLYVEQVVGQGRISAEGECYCYVTTFMDETVCIADITKKGTDKFRLVIGNGEND